MDDPANRIDTRSLCPFPYTYEDDILDLFRNNESLAEEDLGLSALNCTQTYGDALGAPWIGFQIFVGTFMTICTFIFVKRMIELRNFARLVRRRYLDLTQAKVYLCGITISLTMAIEMIDISGFHHIIPAYVYFIGDELIAATALVLTVVIVDFWALVAKGIKKNDSGLPKPVMAFLCIAAYANFLGFEIVGIVDYENYFFWEGLKMFGGIVVLCMVATAAWINVRAIEQQLVSMLKSQSNEMSKSSGDLSIDAEDPSSTQMPSTTSSGGDKERKKTLTQKAMKKMRSFRDGKKKLSSTERVIATLKRKYLQFFAALGFAGLVMMANGVMSITREEENMSWGYSIFEVDLYITIAFLKSIFMVCILIVLHFFNVPSERPTEMQSSNKTKSESTLNTSKAAAGSSSFLSKFTRPKSSDQSKNQVQVGTYSVFDLEDADWQNHEDSRRLLAVLADDQERGEFLAFCESQHGEENVHCWVAIQEFEDAFDQHGPNAEDTKRAFKNVIDNFIAEGASSPVNVSAANLKELRKLSASAMNKDVFGKIKKEIFRIMEENFFERFLDQ